MKYLLLFACLLTLAPPARPAESPRLAIVADAGTTPEADLLTVELSHQPVVLLERAEIERVLTEQKLTMRGLAAAVQVGRLLRADGVLILSKIDQAKASALVGRLVAVESGAVLDSQLAPPELKTSEWIAALGESVRRRSAGLAPGADRPVAISVAGLHAAAGLEAEETPFAALFTHALAQHAGFVVLERQRLLALAQERDFGPDLSAPFWASRLLLGGSIEHDPQTPGGLLVKARLQPPRGAAVDLTVQGSRADLGTLARELARRTAEALHQPPEAVAWDARAEAARFAREARAAHSVGLWDLAEAAGGAAWALGDRGVDLARLRYRIQLERLLNTDRLSDQFGVPVLQSMASTSVIQACERLGQRRSAPYAFEPYAGFRFPEDLAGARRLLDLYWAWAKIAPPPRRGSGPDLEDRSGALTFCLAALPLVLVHRQPEPAGFTAELEALRAQLAETLPQLAAASAARAGSAAMSASSSTGNAETAARGLQQLRYLQGFFAVFESGAPEAWRAALPALLADEGAGDPSRLQLRTGLLKAQAIAPLYLNATWPREVFHEVGLARTKETAPDDRLFTLAMLDGQRLDPTARQAAAGAFPERLWELRESFMRQPVETRAFVDAALRRFFGGRSEDGETKALRAAIQEVRRRLFLHVIGANERVDAAGLWDDLSIANWKTEDAARFNEALLARIAERQGNLPKEGTPFYAGQLSLKNYEIQRLIGWQAQLRRSFPALPAPPVAPGPQPPERPPLQVTHFWNPYLATKLVPVAPEEGFRIWDMTWTAQRLWVHADLRLPASRPIGAPATVRAFLFGIEPRSGATEVVEVPNIGKMNEWQPFGGFAVSADFVLVSKAGSALLKLRRATGEWKAYEQFQSTRQPAYRPIMAGGEAFVSLTTEIARWNLDTDAVTTLVRTRREPAESPLDDPRHARVWMQRGPDGVPVVLAADVPMNGQTTASFRFDPASNQWEKCEPFYENERALHRCILDPEAHEKWVTRGEKGLSYEKTEEVAGQRQTSICAIPLAFALSEKDRTALEAGERTYPAALQAMEKSLEQAEMTLETPDGIIFSRLWTPGFWFLPKEDLAGYVAAHGLVADPRPSGKVIVRGSIATPNGKESKP